MALAAEFATREIPFERQVPLPVKYKDKTLDCGYRLDFLVAGSIVVELKAVEAILPIHDAQLLTYLRLSGCRIGLLLNFNVPMMKEGIVRRIL